VAGHGAAAFEIASMIPPGDAARPALGSGQALRWYRLSSTDTEMFNDARNTTSGHHAAAREGFLFHPREIAFCGYSGSGKTTLISRLIEELTPRYAIGYVKHDAHRFTMDVPGKDTFQALHHGAGTVFINDASHWAMVSNGAPPLAALRAIYAPFDLVFVEGLKESPLRKVVVLDADETILEAVDLGTIRSIALFVGTQDRHPSLPAMYCHRDDLRSITRHLLMALGLGRAQAAEPIDRGPNPGSPAAIQRLPTADGAFQIRPRRNRRPPRPSIQGLKPCDSPVPTAEQSRSRAGDARRNSFPST
jgi:molybdopterin-guanine dinucleotide biosynthesis protein MobB